MPKYFVFGFFSHSNLFFLKKLKNCRHKRNFFPFCHEFLSLFPFYGPFDFNFSVLVSIFWIDFRKSSSFVSMSGVRTLRYFCMRTFILMLMLMCVFSCQFNYSVFRQFFSRSKRIRWPRKNLKNPTTTRVSIDEILFCFCLALSLPTPIGVATNRKRDGMNALREEKVHLIMQTQSSAKSNVEVVGQPNVSSL